MNGVDIGYIKSGLSFEKFCWRYFEAKKIDGKYVDKQGETLNSQIAWEFYTEFQSSGLSLKKYKNLTIKNMED